MGKDKASEKHNLRKKPKKNGQIYNMAYHSPFFPAPSSSTPIKKCILPKSARLQKKTNLISATPKENFFESLHKNNGTYHYQTNSSQGDFASIEAEYIEIKPVSVLQERGNTCYWGAFAKKEMRGPLLLGEYFGKVEEVPEEDSRAERKLTDHQFYNCFQLSDKKALVPAEEEEFWPRKANCASCEQTANVIIQRHGERVFYALPRGVTISAGQQLLPFYGEAYTFESKMFLNPSDNDEDSNEKLRRYPYQSIKIKLNKQLLDILSIPASTKFAKPSLDALDKESINLPLLAHDSQHRVLPQHQQENLTLLHLTCWMGGKNIEEKISKLLAEGANPNQQTRKVGFSPMQAIVMSPYYDSAAQKIACIEHLKNAGGTLMLQDKHEISILHCAIQSGQVELVAHLIQLDRNVKLLLNKDDQDFFLYAIAIGSITALRALEPLITHSYLAEYLDDDEEFDYLVQTLKKVRKTLSNDDFRAFETTVMSIFQAKNIDLYDALLRKHFHPVPSDLSPTTSL